MELNNPSIIDGREYTRMYDHSIKRDIYTDIFGTRYTREDVPFNNMRPVIRTDLANQTNNYQSQVFVSYSDDILEGLTSPGIENFVKNLQS